MSNKRFICIVWADEESFFDPKVFTTKEKAEAWGNEKCEELGGIRYDVDEF